MRDQGVHFLRTLINERASGQRKGVPGIYHVIDQDRNLKAHRAHLMDDRQSSLDEMRTLSRTSPTKTSIFSGPPGFRLRSL